MVASKQRRIRKSSAPKRRWYSVSSTPGGVMGGNVNSAQGIVVIPATQSTLPAVACAFAVPVIACPCGDSFSPRTSGFSYLPGEKGRVRFDSPGNPVTPPVVLLTTRTTVNANTQ